MDVKTSYKNYTTAFEALAEEKHLLKPYMGLWPDPENGYTQTKFKTELLSTFYQTPDTLLKTIEKAKSKSDLDTSYTVLASLI